MSSSTQTDKCLKIPRTGMEATGLRNPRRRPCGPAPGLAVRRSTASVLFRTFCALAAVSGPGGAFAGDGGTETAAPYGSRAGAVLGTYRPAPTDRSAQTMARAAARFLDTLDEAQGRSARYGLASPERRKWTNAPVRGQAGGIALGDLDEVRLRAFSDLLAALLSEKGYGKVRDVMLGDDLRATVDGEPNEGVGIEAFRFAVFGEPSPTSRWAVQLDGHHVALNITLDGGAYSLSPGFIGTYPPRRSPWRARSCGRWPRRRTSRTIWPPA